jgi:hypothetical protein
MGLGLWWFYGCWGGMRVSIVVGGYWMDGEIMVLGAANQRGWKSYGLRGFGLV